MNFVPPVPFSVAARCSRRVGHLWVCAALGFTLVLLADMSPTQAAGSVEVEPARLLVAANLHDPIVLRLEVTTTEPDAAVDLRVVGLRVQREVRQIDPTHRLFLIELDTTKKGRVDGQVDVVDSSGAVLGSVPITGEVKPLIRASPAHIFLGSLEYGTPSARVLEKQVRLSADIAWEITGVDASAFPHVQWEIRNEADGSKELQVRFSEDDFKAKAPFGAFIQRSVRLKTDNQVQPEIVIAFEGMLSRNATKRNFSTYVFRGNERWQGWWNTPNLAAAVVSPLILLLLGCSLLLGSHRNQPKLLWRTLAVSAGLGAFLGMWLLVRTYSRGGWFALGVGLGLMLWLMPRHRVALAAAVFVFLGLIVFLPAGMQRAASAGALGEDASISHRLLVWRGALEMIADHPVRGVGAGKFGQVFQTAYQEPWHKDEYTTAINDYLTFGAERGGVGVLGVVGAVVIMAVAAVGYSCRYGDVWVVPVVSALLTLGTSSVFSSVEFVGQIRFLYGLILGTLAIYCGLRFALERRGQRTAGGVTGGKVWLPAAVTGLAVGGLLVGMVVCTGWARPAIGPVPQEVSGKNFPAARLEYLPGRLVPPKGILLFLPASAEPLTTLGRQVLRPLAQSGWQAMVLDLRMYDQEAAEQVIEVLHGLTGPTLILAEGARARVAVRVTQLLDLSQRPHLVFVDPVLFSALGECDQSSARGFTVGTTVVAGERWQTFKRDGHSGLNTILQACDASLRHSSAPPDRTSR